MRTCTTHPTEPTLTPSLPYCRICLGAQIDRDRENRAAQERLNRERARQERRREHQQEEAAAARMQRFALYVEEEA
jgi:hypothetical protein